jgi:hypothetical protein
MCCRAVNDSPLSSSIDPRCWITTAAVIARSTSRRRSAEEACFASTWRRAVPISSASAAIDGSAAAPSAGICASTDARVAASSIAGSCSRNAPSSSDVSLWISAISSSHWSRALPAGSASR